MPFRPMFSRCMQSSTIHRTKSDWLTISSSLGTVVPWAEGIAALVLVSLLLDPFELDLDSGLGLPHCISDLSADEALNLSLGAARSPTTRAVTNLDRLTGERQGRVLT